MKIKNAKKTKKKGEMFLFSFINHHTRISSVSVSKLRRSKYKIRTTSERQKVRSKTLCISVFSFLERVSSCEVPQFVARIRIENISLLKEKNREVENWVESPLMEEHKKI